MNNYFPFPFTIIFYFIVITIIIIIDLLRHKINAIGLQTYRKWSITGIFENSL